MLEQFSIALGKLYSAAAGEVPWDEALMGLEDLTRSAGAVIDLVPKNATAGAKTLAGSFTEENCAEYARDYMALCPRIRFGMANPSFRTTYDYLFITEAEMDRDPVYEWFGKHGLRYFVGGVIAETSRHHITFGLQRSRKQGHASVADVRLFDVIKPHVASAVNIAEQLGTLRAHQRFSAVVLESLPQALYVLDGSGMLQFANERGRALLSRGQELRLVDGHLAAGVSDRQDALHCLVRSAIAPLGGPAGGWLRLPRASGHLPYAVFVAPLPVPSEDFGDSARVLVIVHDAEATRAVDGPLLTTIYGLTETEARLASALSAGHSLESASALLGMRVATARSHLKAIFAKFGVNRQQDLVRLLTSIGGIVA